MVGRGTVVLGLTGAPTKAPAPDTAGKNYSISYCRGFEAQNYLKTSTKFSY